MHWRQPLGAIRRFCCRIATVFAGIEFEIRESFSLRHSMSSLKALHKRTSHRDDFDELPLEEMEAVLCLNDSRPAFALLLSSSVVLLLGVITPK